MRKSISTNNSPAHFSAGKKAGHVPSSSLNTACWRRMTQTGEEILGLGSEMLFAAVVLKLGLVHARFHGSHFPRRNSCTKCTTRKAKKRVLTHILSVLTHIHDQ